MPLNMSMHVVRCHVPDLVESLWPADLAALACLDRSHASLAASTWAQVTRTLPERLVRRWVCPCHGHWAPCGVRPLDWLAVAREAQATARPRPRAVQRFLDLWTARTWMATRVINTWARKALHDLRDDHDRPLDCRRVRVGAAARVLFRAVLQAGLDHVGRTVPSSHVAATAYCMLAVDVRVQDDGRVVVVSGEKGM